MSAQFFPEDLVVHLAKNNGTDVGQIEQCLEETQKLTQMKRDVIVKALWEVSQALTDKEISILVNRVDEMFGLNAHEKDTLRSYLQFMHKERRDKFVASLQGKDRSYVTNLLDTELEEFGDESFSVSFEDFKDPNQPTKRLILYNEFVTGLRAKSKSEREKEYQILGVVFETNEDKKQRRTKLYTSFISHLSKKANFDKYTKTQTL